MRTTRSTKILAIGGIVAALGCGGSGTSSTGGGAATHTTVTTSEGGAGGSVGSGGRDAGAGASCPGQCVHGPASGWDFPALIWMGAKKEDAPACPITASLLAFEGHADLDAPNACGGCACAAPQGACALPATMTANAASCAADGPSTPHTSFSPASGWTGACDTNASIPSGKLCAGVPCVQSLTIAPLVMTEAGCAPVAQPPPPPPAVWKSFVRGCRSIPHDPCPESGFICMPSSPPGFRVCIYHDGDIPCPTQFTPYTDRRVYYQEYDDTRACSSCACGAPAGSACTASISIHTNGACGALAYTAAVSSDAPNCHDLPAGTPLGSKASTPPVYKPGACAASGGEPMGAATPVQASTYCCLPGP